MSYTISICRKGYESNFTWKDKVDIQLYRFLAEIMFADRVSLSHTVQETPNTIGVFCTISDILTGQSISRVHESELAEKKPLTNAYDFAFVMAVRDFLQVKCEENTEEKANNEPQKEKKAPSKSSISDEDILLIGNMRGRKIGEVKDSAQFYHFLEQILAVPDLTFPDEERRIQVEQLKELAKEVVHD